jgi:hypothetical protein
MPIAMSVAMPIVTLMMLHTSTEHNTRPEKCDQRNQDQESGASTPSILATAHSEPASIFITAATISQCGAILEQGRRSPSIG